MQEGKDEEEGEEEEEEEKKKGEDEDEDVEGGASDGPGSSVKTVMPNDKPGSQSVPVDTIPSDTVVMGQVTDGVKSDPQGPSKAKPSKDAGAGGGGMKFRSERTERGQGGLHLGHTLPPELADLPDSPFSS